MIAITGARIFSGQTYTGQGTILVRNGKIVAAGANFDIPSEALVLEVAGKTVTPGLIDAHTHLGVCAEALAWAGDEVNETSDPVTPAMHVLDAIYPDDLGFSDAIGGGVTAAMIAPGSANAVGGQCVVVKTRPRKTVEQMLLRRHAGLKIAFGENPRRVYGEEQKKAPVTRMATAALIRATLVKARAYLDKLDQGDKDQRRDLGMEAVAKVLSREMPLRAHAHRADDIATALRIAGEFGVDIVIDHCTEGHLIPEVLAARGVMAAVGPNLGTRAKIELRDMSYSTPRILAEHGVRFALVSDHPVLPTAFLPLYAGLAVRFGLPAEQALRAITSDAADLLGVGDRIGTLAPGMDADLVVWSGDPLALCSRPETVMVDGVMATVNVEQKVYDWK